MKHKNILFIFSISFLVILFDQLTKYIISHTFALSESITLIKNLLEITYIRNTGAGFGIFRGANIILIFTSLIIIGIILFYFDKILKEKPSHIPLALILGGAVGNLIDRLFLGHVIDFIYIRFWPAFNVADSCISIGAVWLIIYYWKK
ncbi:MAG: signal peptidase II [Nanoarchaeota archaeon]|nr:signal peptidase II [Nanoarchaeota archaeon]MBU1005841.1 signal peptidase II [Nanoarchaeota archaeon]MBU1946115.1 signal peptidase II [Nanoarchaeota archaeon]